ncbi:cation:proton antiporter [Caldiplasma sukawensis]
MVLNGELSLLQVSLILIIASFSIPIARKASIVEIPVLIGFGLLFGPVLNFINTSFSSYMLDSFAQFGIGIFGLTIILYSESHTINFRIFRKFAASIISLSTLGIFITAIVAGFLFSMLTGAPFLIGFLFGVIVSPTDPSTLIPLFKKIRIKDDYTGTLIGESIFNDPLSIILTAIAVVLIDPTSSTSPVFSYLLNSSGVAMGAVYYFLIQITVPSIAGVIIGFTIIYLNKFLNFENLIVGLMLGTILFELTVFEGLGITPFPAIIGTGAIIGNYASKNIFWTREESFQQNLSYLSQGLIFILVGSILTVNDFSNYLIIGVILTLLIMFVARPIAVFLSIAYERKKKTIFNWRTKLFISLSGPKGVVSIVQSTIPLSVGLATGNTLLIKWGGFIEIVVSFVVLFSIVFQTLYIPALSGHLLPKDASIQVEQGS